MSRVSASAPVTERTTRIAAMPSAPAENPPRINIEVRGEAENAMSNPIAANGSAIVFMMFFFLTRPP